MHLTVRRVRRSEQDGLVQLCRADLRWKKYYPSHHSWLDHALSDIKSPARVVFGAYGLERLGPTQVVEPLQACIFLKWTPHQDSAELKNLVVRLPSASSLPNSRDSEHFSICTQLLVEKAVRFCEAREIAHLEIELPQEEAEVVALFLKLGFRLVALREKHAIGLRVCVLERRIGDTYSADPFDAVKLGRWLLRALLPATISPVTYFENVAFIRFESEMVHPGFLRTEAGELGRLEGWLAILETGEIDNQTLEVVSNKLMSIKSAHVRYMLTSETLTTSTQERLSSKGILCFSRASVAQIAGGPCSSLAIPFGHEVVQGATTVLEQHLVEEYAKYSTFKYYLLSGIGAVLDIPETIDYSDTPFLLAIYCHSWISHKDQPPLSGIVGVAEIDRLAHSTWTEAKGCFPDAPSALTAEDLDYYRTYSDADPVTVLLCRRISLFERPLQLDVASSPLPREEADYLHQEFANNLSSAAYISESFCRSLALLRVPSNDVSSNEASIPTKQGSVSKEPSSRTSGKLSRPTLQGTSMRILFASAAPPDKQHLDIEREKKLLDRELKTVTFRQEIATSWAYGVEGSELIQHLSDFQPTVFHFSGHGARKEIFLRGQGRRGVVKVQAAQLCAVLKNRNVELVVLNSCYSASLARELIKVVPAVVGTTNAVDDKAACEFTAAFYRSLGQGNSVNVSLADAGDVLTIQNNNNVYNGIGELHQVLVGPNRSRG